MLRRPVITSVLSLTLLPHFAGALGLGDIRTRSALNEPFVGQIELLDIAPDELDTVRVRLASEAEFDKAGTERPRFLTGLEFEPQVSAEGRAFIQVTSRQPVREPFLDFLIEVDWPQGRLVKAYTVLLDPPVTSNRRPSRRGRPGTRPPAQTPSLETAGSGEKDLPSVPVADELVRREIAELRSRIRELEIQLADTRRLVALGNEKLAALQQVQPTQSDGPDTEATDIPPSESEATQASGRTTSRAAAATPTTKAASAPAAPHPSPERPLRESIPWSALALAPTLALPILLLGWMQRRRRHRQETPILREPVLETSGTAAMGVTIGAGPAEQTPAGPAPTPITRTLVPYGRSGDPDGEMGEADPVSEADLYITTPSRTEPQLDPLPSLPEDSDTPVSDNRILPWPRD